MIYEGVGGWDISQDDLPGKIKSLRNVPFLNNCNISYEIYYLQRFSNISKIILISMNINFKCFIVFKLIGNLWNLHKF